jgi:hypothetical protein
MDNRKRYQRYNQNPSIKGQTTQWTTEKDTKGIIRIRQSKNRQHNGKKKKDKRANNDLQNIYIKLKIE